ncbi:hypothetical protein KSP39_PZI001895 [Platanthera zijinensis]|uniref:Uncharacterized protein n=1 Tax=Platanthera zijinensis TaxID=2320716 RepID=A0AAP0GDZ4_9ASPA
MGIEKTIYRSELYAGKSGDRSMDATASGASSSVSYHNLIDQPLSLVTPLQQILQRCQRHCFGNAHPGEFPLATSPFIVLHILTSCDLNPGDLARLEASNNFHKISMRELRMALMRIGGRGRQHAFGVVVDEEERPGV